MKAFPLYAEAYVGNKKDQVFLTHACEVDAEGFAVRVICGNTALWVGVSSF